MCAICSPRSSPTSPRSSSSTDSHTPEELQRLAAEASHAAQQAQAELERRAAETAAAELAVQQAGDRRIVSEHLTWDEQLQARGREYGEEFDQAVQARDLPAAFAAWVNERSTREARRHIRTEAINAESRVQTGKRILPELRYYEPDLLSRLEGSGDAAARTNGADLADALIGDDR